MLDRYGELVALAQRESELIEAGRWSELVELEHARNRLIAAMPARAPAEARELLEQAKAIVTRNMATILTATDRTREQLALVGLGRQAIAGYSATPAGSAFVDQRG